MRRCRSRCAPSPSTRASIRAIRSMIAFGGAGPLHALAIARDIFVPNVVIPRLPGNFSALGMLMAVWRQDFVRTLIGRLGTLDPVCGGPRLRRTRRGRTNALAPRRIARRACDASALRADLRYIGQEHALPIAVDGSGDVDRRHCRSGAPASISNTNSVTARRRSTKSLEIVNMRLVLTVPTRRHAVPKWLAEPWEPGSARRRRDAATCLRAMRENRRRRHGSCGGRRLPPARALGPAVIEEAEFDILIHPGDRVTSIRPAISSSMLAPAKSRGIRMMDRPIRSPSKSCAMRSSPMPTKWPMPCANPPTI